MPVLKNPKHEAFAQAVALGAKQSRAYRKHVGKKCSAKTADEEGCKLAKSPKVLPRIEELRGRVAAKADAKFDMTKDSWLDELRQIANEARRCEDFSAASSALAHIGKACSFFDPEKHQMNVIVTLGGNADSRSSD